MNRKILIIILLVINITATFYWSQESKKVQNTKVTKYLGEMQQLYSGAAEAFRLNAINTFDTMILNPEVFAILRQLEGATPEKTAQLHEQMHDLIVVYYDRLKAHIDTRQLHFHHTDGRSFLRMHRPEKYGDPLFDVRYSVYVANTQKKFAEGFEEGRIFNGYRYVFPLLEGDAHYGSVEISFAMCAFMKWFAKLHPDNGFYFMLKQDVIDKKVFTSEKSNYRTSRLIPHYAEDKTSCIALSDTYTQILNSFKPNEKVLRYIDEARAFIHPYDFKGEQIVMTFLPVKNVQNTQVAYVVRFDDGSWLSIQKTQLFYKIALLAVLSLLLFLFAHTLLSRKERAEREQERLQHILDELETLRSVVEAAPVSMVIADLEGNIEYVNPRFSELTGYAMQEALGHNPNILKSGWTTDEEYHFLWETITSGKVWSGTFKNIKKDGQEYWEHAVIAPVKNAAGEIIHFLGVKQEITEEVHLRQKLLAKDVQIKTLATLVENSTLEIYIFDENTLQFLYANSRAAEDTLYSSEELKTMTPLDLKRMRKSEFMKLLQPLHENRQEYITIKTTHYRKDGTSYPVGVRIQKTIFNQTQAYTSVVTDATEQEKLNKKLSDMNEMMMMQSRYAAMGEMIGLLAHQWRQPIAVIEMGINNLLVDLELDMGDKQGMIDALNNIATYTQRMSQMISEFRSHFTSDPNQKAYAVSDVIHEVGDVLKSSLDYHNIVLTIESEEQVVLDAHKDGLFQTLITLLTNAKEILIERKVKAPAITIRSRRQHNDLLISVSDNGGGIDAKYMGKIFEPYFTTKESLNDSGTGLYITKIIMEKKFHGSITAVNTTEGASFMLRIPLDSDTRDEVT